MSEIELDFEDDSLGETLDVDSEIVDPIIEPIVEPEVVKPKPGRPVLGLVDNGLPVWSTDNLLRALSSSGVMWTSLVSLLRP